MFYGDGTSFSSTVSGGLAVVTHSYTTAGTYPVTATYNGNPKLHEQFEPATQMVNQAFTTTSLTPSPAPSVVGQSVTFTATVSAVSPGSGTPSGTVTFNFGDGSAVATASLVGGVATIAHTYTTATTFTATATYNGDTNFITSLVSNTQAVNQTTTTTVSSSQNPSGAGQR